MGFQFKQNMDSLDPRTGGRIDKTLIWIPRCWVNLASLPGGYRPHGEDIVNMSGIAMTGLTAAGGDAVG